MKAIFSSSYLKAVGSLTSGQLAASVIPLAAAPILGRLYLPADYGVLSIYMAISSLLSVFATLQLHNAIIAETSEKKAIVAFQLAVAAAFAISLLTAVGVAVATLSISFDVEFSTLRFWIWLLPLTVFSGGLTVALQALANRYQYYRSLSIIPVITTGLTAALSIGLGAAGFGSDGLLITYLVGQLTNMLGWLVVLRNKGNGASRPKTKRIKAVFVRHRHFATYTLGSELVSAFNMQIPILALSGIGAVATAGAFTRARQVAGMPVQLLGGSVAMVFRQRAAAALSANGSCRALYLSTMLGLLGVGLIPAAVLIFYAPEFFVIILGPNWEEAGQVCRIIVPMLLMRLAVTPVSTIFYLTGGQRTDLMINLLGSVSMYVLVGWLFFIDTGPHWMIGAYALAYAMIYLAYAILGERRTKLQGFQLG